MRLQHPQWQSNVTLAQRGFALILVLWILSLLTIMAGSFALSIRRESSIISGLKNNTQAAAVAESGIAIAELMLLNRDQAKRWQANGSIYPIDDSEALGSENAQVRVRLWSETGKIDINKADQKLLATLMANSPIQDEQQQLKLVGAILDWRDEDDLINIEGAEKKDYQQAGLTYQPRNKPFQTLTELQLVLGMNETIYQWLIPLVTVYSGRPNVNVQLAAKEVLQVLPDADLDLINDFVVARLESMMKGLPAPTSPFSIKQNAVGATATKLGQGDALTIVSEALLDDGSSAVIKAVIKAGGAKQPFQVLEWQRNTTSEDSLFSETIGASAISELLVNPIK